MRFFYACMNCGAVTESSIEQISYSGSRRCHPDMWLSDFFGWLFRKGWATISILSLIWFYSLVLLFTVIIMWAANIDPDCLRIGGKTVAEIGKESVRSFFPFLRREIRAQT